MENFKEVINNGQNVLIATALLLTAFLVVGIQFLPAGSLKSTSDEQVQSFEESQPPTPLIRKDTYTISSKNPPYFTWASFDPLDYEEGEVQVVEVKIENRNPVDMVGVIMITDNQSKDYKLELVEGTSRKGTWRGSWTTGDSHSSKYQAALYAKSESEESKVVITFR